MAIGPDDLTSWRPDDESYEVAEETAAERKLFLESIAKIEIFDLVDLGETCAKFMEASNAASAAGLTMDQWRELPRAHCEMLLQCYRASRPLR